MRAHGDGSKVEKVIEFVTHLGEALKALNNYSAAMTDCNNLYNRLLQQAGKCRPQAFINPKMLPFTVPHFDKLRRHIPLPPDTHSDDPIPHITIGLGLLQTTA